MGRVTESYYRYLDGHEANALRLIAIDCIDRLARHRKVDQLRILEVQLQTALEQIEQRKQSAAQASRKVARRSLDELVWKSKAEST